MNANDKIHENKRDIGKRYEELAADYLCKKGVEILERNYRNHTGEIDLIGRDGECLVFIEVKYRRDTREGDPGEAISPLKQQRIRKAALVYLYEHRLPMDIPCRFDVVTILGKEIRLIRDAF